MRIHTSSMHDATERFYHFLVFSDKKKTEKENNNRTIALSQKLPRAACCA